MARTEPSRTRANGTRVTSSKNGDEIIAACREIVANGQYAKINGQMVDLFTASAIVKVFDAVNDSNKAKLRTLTVERLARVSMQMVA